VPRTTLDLDDGVLRELKRRRERQHRSLGAIASELLAQAFVAEPDVTPEMTWAVQSMGAKIDIEDKDAVWAALDRS
jgi:plasmid stability protein